MELNLELLANSLNSSNKFSKHTFLFQQTLQADMIFQGMNIDLFVVFNMNDMNA